MVCAIGSINILLALINGHPDFCVNKYLLKIYKIEDHDEITQHLLDMAHKILIALRFPPAIEDIK